jgi:hypothetical protein
MNVCTKNKNAFLVLPPPEYKVLSGRQLPWQDGTLKWGLGNWTKDMEKHHQVSIFKDVFADLNYELWPLRYISTDDISQAVHKIFFVHDDDHVYINGNKQFRSPFLFSESKSTIAVQYTYAPGFEYSLHMFVADHHFFTLKEKENSFVLSKVILHEALHGLGLDHFNFPGDIMNPYYQVENRFTQDSRDGLNKIHKKARAAEIYRSPAAKYLISNFLKPKKNSIMNEPKWRGVARHVLTMAGTVLVTLGFFNLVQDDVTGLVDNLDIIVGAVLNIASIFASIKTREKQISNSQFKAMKSY